MPPAPEKFPSISNKLSQPKKLSTFERERQEAETKRLREAVATQKALQDFEEEFAGNDDHSSSHTRGPARPHFSDSRDDFRTDRLDARHPRDLPSGRLSDGMRPGRPSFNRDRDRDSRGPQRTRSRDAQRGGREVAEFGTSGPPPTLKRKRLEDERSEGSGSAWETGRRASGFEPEAFEDARDGREDKDVRHPTALLHCLPAGTSEGDVRALVHMLAVEEVVFITPERRGDVGRAQDRQRQGPKMSALVIADPQTPVSEVDNAVSALAGKYLGFGSYLKISRHISLTGGQTPRTNDLALADDSRPFGARPRVHSQASNINLRNAPPPRDLDRVSDRPRTSSAVEVAVRPPNDIKVLRLVHSTAEKLLIHGPEFEAILMSDPTVQHDEKWAWLFDPSHDAAVYYRWVIWNLARGQQPLALHTDSDIFDSGPIWSPPSTTLRFASTQVFEDLVHDSAYESSDDEAEPAPSAGLPDPDHAKYLNPYRQAKLTHLLARLPESIAFLRAGDVARVTSFVVNNAGHGAEEIVDMVLRNIETPFRGRVVYDSLPDGEELYPLRPQVGSEKDRDKPDPSAPKLIALYILSDILQASSVSGVKDAWKYRTLFETALSDRKTFAHLGSLEKVCDWGRMKAEQWKRKIGFVLSLWEGRSIFPKAAMEGFKADFEAACGYGGADAAATKTTSDAGIDTGKWKTSTAPEAQPTASGPATTATGLAAATDAAFDPAALIAQKIAAIKAKAGFKPPDPVATPSSSSTQTGSQAGLGAHTRSESDAHTHAQSQTGPRPGIKPGIKPGVETGMQSTTSSGTSKRYRPTAAELNDARTRAVTDHSTGPSTSRLEASASKDSFPEGQDRKPNTPALGFSLSLSAATGTDSDDKMGDKAGFSLGPARGDEGSAVAGATRAGAQRGGAREKSSLDDMFDSD